ncbi:MAG: LPS assembly protein LptD [Mariprofundaceae bacterium]|nr:LPS assembly protein LptD [Mariprofundaceae bacterium]
MQTTWACAISLIFLLHSPIAQARIDLLADQVVRDSYGEITADGHVEATRNDELLRADHLRYHPLKKEIYARGNVELQSPTASIQAKSARLHTINQSAQLKEATVTLPDGQHIRAMRLQRVDKLHFTGEDVIFTECSLKDPAWLLRASRIKVDQEAGEMSVENARFEVAGIPIFYSPYWQYPLRRKSGLLMPMISTSQRRGTEFSMPYYIAPTENWDATFTPRWMTARGLMNELEIRHISTFGHEQWYTTLLQDKVTGTRRYQIEGNMLEQLPLGFTVQADINQTSDNQYLSDFSADGTMVSARFIQSKASVGWQGELGNVTLLGLKQQDLSKPDNNKTLQWLPRLDANFTIPLINDVQLHLDQQITRFSRPLLISGWRMHANPWLEIPFTPFAGAVEITVQAGMHQWNYWQLRNNPLRADRARAYETSIQGVLHLERISKNRHWRHEITPTMRFDYAVAPNQSTLPRFDTAFSRLTLNNLMQGNRFTGLDRVERMKRLSLMLRNDVQFNDKQSKRKWSVVSLGIGTAWDFLRSSVDPRLSPVPTRNYANLLGEFSLSPNPNFHLSAEGQYDPIARYWATVNAALRLNHESGKHHLSVTWQHTDARYVPTAINLIGLNISANFYRRWQLSSLWQYDSILKLTQQATVSIAYKHPCWNINLEGFRINRAGSTSSSNSGFRFTLGFKGLGSIGGK